MLRNMKIEVFRGLGTFGKFCLQLIPTSMRRLFWSSLAAPNRLPFSGSVIERREGCDLRQHRRSTDCHSSSQRDLHVSLECYSQGCGGPLATRKCAVFVMHGAVSAEFQ